MTERVKGSIKRFSQEKRYGFIQRGDGLPDVFVHMNGFRSVADARWTKDEDTVEFEVEQTPRGPKASDAVILYNTTM
jgi:CspA family cold shock protein